MRTPSSLRTRLFAAIGLIVALSVGLALLIGSVLTRREVERNALSGLARQADILAAGERKLLLPLGPVSLKNLEKALAPQSERVLAAPLDGTSPYLPADDVAEIRAGHGTEGAIELRGTDYFYAARPVRGKAFVLLRPKRLSANASKPYLEGLLYAALAGAALAGACAFLLARAIARPVRRVAEAARALGQSGESPPVPVAGARELALLAESFNDMGVQLRRAREAERRFLLSVSHELKTPLTAIRGYAEGLAEGVLPLGEAADTIRLEAVRLERLVRDLLDLARMNRREFAIEAEPIDLADTVQEVVQRYDAQARSFEVALDAVLPGPAPALGDPGRVLQVVSNLVENALRATPPGGSVRVLARPGAVTVEDTGPGLRPEELPRAFERFFLYERYGGERPVGTGLGLAIVKELTERMGGSVEVRSEPGRGASFLVRLPASAARERERALVEA